MPLNVIPGWVKVLLLAAIVTALGWWGWSGFRKGAAGDPAPTYSRPRVNPGAGLPGQARSNVRQLFVNPLEQAASVPEGEGGTLREGGRNYYKDE